MISVLLALLTAGSNATASVLQRRAAVEASVSAPTGLALLAELARRKIWLAGIGMVVAAALLQAAALATGPIALVQPIFILELPLTLLFGGLVIRRMPSPRIWGAVALVTVALGAGLAAAQPGGGADRAIPGRWVITLIATALFELVVISAGFRVRGEARAALLGLAAACGYSFTAALMKDAMALLGHGSAAFLSSWQLYATAAAGVGSLYLLQNALQAGTLAASQPMVTVGDALISIAYGVTLYGEQLRTGVWLIPQLVALALITIGYIEIAKSPLASGHAGQLTDEARARAAKSRRMTDQAEDTC